VYGRHVRCRDYRRAAEKAARVPVVDTAASMRIYVGQLQALRNPDPDPHLHPGGAGGGGGTWIRCSTRSGFSPASAYFATCTHLVADLQNNLSHGLSPWLAAEPSCSCRRDLLAPKILLQALWHTTQGRNSEETPALRCAAVSLEKDGADFVVQRRSDSCSVKAQLDGTERFCCEGNGLDLLPHNSLLNTVCYETLHLTDSNRRTTSRP
jgi:hypothetical protein